MHPTGLVGMAPLSLEHNFYRGLLDRLGIEVEVLARREFKSAFNQLSERGFTSPDREQSQRLLDSLWERQVDDVARARKLAPETVRRLADRAPLLANEALDGGLVDRLAYTDEVVSAAKATVGPKSKLLYLAAYKRRAGKGRQPGKSVPVAVLRAVGEIHRSSTLPIGLRGRPVLAADRLIPQIRAAAKDKKVKAFVLRIDSPGGSAVASDAIWRELVKLRELGKPLVVSMGAVAASGGYYLATAADRVVAQPGTITGSIGVITMRPMLARAKAKLDVTADEVHTGAEPSMFLGQPRSLSGAASADGRRTRQHLRRLHAARSRGAEAPDREGSRDSQRASVDGRGRQEHRPCRRARGTPTSHGTGRRAQWCSPRDASPAQANPSKARPARSSPRQATRQQRRHRSGCVRRRGRRDVSSAEGATPSREWRPAFLETR